MRSRLLVLFAALCFATTGTSRELGPDSATSLGVAVVRFFVGALALWALTRLFAERTRKKTPVAPLLWVIAGAGQALYGATFFAAVRSTGVAVGTVVALGSTPLITGALSFILGRSLPSRRWLIATTVAIVGIALIVSSDAASDIAAEGVLYALFAGLGYAIFALASKKLVATGMPSNAVMTRVFALAALFLSPTLFFVDVSWVTTPGGITLALWLGIVTVALAYWAYAQGLKHLKPREATMLTLFEPAVATVLGAVVLGERPTMVAWIGIVVVAGAILIETLTPDEVRIVPLAEHPELWNLAASWSVTAWRHEFPNDTEQTYLDQYAMARNPEGRLIEVYAAITAQGSLRGLATLVDDDDLPGATEPGPWLAAVFVHESARREGIGSQLVDHVTNRARHLAHHVLFLYTEHSVEWYRNKGWMVVRETTLNALPHTVMRKLL
ncbi:MAG: GNAT family N-acetyltransferase [Ilumatobacteraceae bacterium]